MQVGAGGLSIAMQSYGDLLPCQHSGNAKRSRMSLSIAATGSRFNPAPMSIAGPMRSS